jgi:hypothetical protein
MNKVELRNAIANRFTVEEIQLLCFELGINHQNFSSRLNILATEIVEYCERTNQLQQLVQICGKLRPQFDDWNYTNTRQNSLVTDKLRKSWKKSGVGVKSSLIGGVFVLIVLLITIYPKIFELSPFSIQPPLIIDEIK